METSIYLVCTFTGSPLVVSLLIVAFQRASLMILSSRFFSSILVWLPQFVTQNLVKEFVAFSIRKKKMFTHFLATYLRSFQDKSFGMKNFCLLGINEVINKHCCRMGQKVFSAEGNCQMPTDAYITQVKVKKCLYSLSYEICMLPDSNITSVMTFYSYIT